jgi:hypothetical protein
LLSIKANSIITPLHIKALDKKELNAQSRKEKGIAQRLSPNDKHLSPL